MSKRDCWAVGLCECILHTYLGYSTSCLIQERELVPSHLCVGLLYQICILEIACQAVRFQTSCSVDVFPIDIGSWGRTRQRGCPFSIEIPYYTISVLILCAVCKFQYAWNSQITLRFAQMYCIYYIPQCNVLEFIFHSK